MCGLDTFSTPTAFNSNYILASCLLKSKNFGKKIVCIFANLHIACFHACTLTNFDTCTFINSHLYIFLLTYLFHLYFIGITRIFQRFLRKLQGFYGLAKNHLELCIWVGRLVGFDTNFNTSSLSERPSLWLLDSLTGQLYSNSQNTNSLHITVRKRTCILARA